MGFTRFYYTDTSKPQPMSAEEVRAGVRAIKEVVRRRSSEFRVDHETATSILVNVRSENPVESLSFDPAPTRNGLFVLKFGFCKTNGCSEDEGVREMLEALQRAVRGKLHISGD